MAKKRTSSRRGSVGSGKAARLPGSPQLDALARKCADDPVFFDYLLRDPDAAMGSGGVNLTGGDAQRVKLAVEGGAFTASISIDQLKRALQKVLSGEWPPPTWLCIWVPVLVPRARRARVARTRRGARKRSASGRR